MRNKPRKRKPPPGDTPAVLRFGGLGKIRRDLGGLPGGGFLFRGLFRMVGLLRMFC